MDEDLKITSGEEGNEAPAFQLLYDLNKEEKDRVLEQFKGRLNASEKYMKKLYPSMIANYKKYCSVADPIVDEFGKEDTERANLFLPYPHAIVEAEMPRLAGRLPRARAFPKRDAERVKTDAIQDLIYYSLDRMNFIQIQTLWMRQYSIYGWSPLYYYWRRETGSGLARTSQTIPGSESPAYPIQRVKRTKYDDFWATVLDVFDCFFQPGVEVIENGDYFFFREWCSAKELRKMVKDGVLYPEVLDYLKENSSPTYKLSEGSEGRRERDEIKGLIPSDQDHTYGKYELMWMLEDERIVQALDRELLVRIGDNPNPLQEIPIINCNLTPLINEPIGVGTIESLAGLPDKLNALSNARLDNVAILLNRVFLVNRNDQQTDFKNIRTVPGNIILTGDVEKSIKALEFPDLSRSSEIEVRDTKQDMQFVSSVSDYIQGTKTSSKLVDTATGVTTVVREGNAKFALKLSAFEAGALRKFIEVIHAYNMTYMPEEKRIHVVGPKGVQLRDIKLEDILCECDFVVEPGSCVPLDQASRRDSLMNLFDRLIQVPMLVRLDKFARELIESFDIRNAEDLMIQQEGPKSVVEDMQLAEAENIALSQRMRIALAGNDGLHIGIHQSVDTSNWDPEALRNLASHVEQHEMKMRIDMQKARLALVGGQNGNTPNAPGAGAAASLSRSAPGMGGPARIPAVPGRTAP